MQFFPTRMCNVTAWRHSRLLAHWLMALVWGGGGGWGRSMYSAFPGNCSVPYLSFVYGRSLWAELNGGENSLHWKANMLPLFSIMTLYTKLTLLYAHAFEQTRHKILVVSKVNINLRGQLDNMEAPLLLDERTDFVSTNRLGHGWAYQKLANQQAISRAGCKDGCDWLPA